MKKQAFTLSVFITLFWACTDLSQQETRVETAPELYVPPISTTLNVGSFPQPERNPMSQEGVLLGKKLFFDPNLSGNGKVSCATCHQPQLAFTDGVALGDHGVTGAKLDRHAPPLFNLAWNTNGLFWDGGAHDLESLNFGPLTHPDEMGADLNALLTYLNQEDEYLDLFEKAFPKSPIQSASISQAIAQYTRTLISQTSRYDLWKNGKTELSSLEIKGYKIYQAACASCHEEGLFTDQEYHNNGLDESYPDPIDKEGIFLGRFRITQDSLDLGAYKTPSLRNVTLTAPYMHDGRFATLEEVLDHYSSGIQQNSSLAPQLKGGIPLNAEEKQALITFLQTLQDDQFIQHHQQDNPDLP
ncbi:cytochrome-c peroxidase [Algoriphagus vanfongensis]|uniref:cytochrome-c peroxidase n=1 Tax=Algoriphagus vanfongensis TaxID=426371 RepID=UPI0004210DAE|nr:cytochrome c peroxidase [Algoriphagus vanfongensis]